jgi:hypothetical protein
MKIAGFEWPRAILASVLAALLLLCAVVGQQGVNAQTTGPTSGFSAQISQSTQDEIRAYAKSLVALAGGAAAITDTDLAATTSAYGVSWWEIIGNLMVADSLVQQLSRQDYKGAVKTLGDYAVSETLLSGPIVGRLSGAQAIAQLAALPVTSQLNALARDLNNRGIACQQRLYYAARSAPLNLSHSEIINKSPPHSISHILLYDGSGYFKAVEFNKCTVGLGVIHPLWGLSRDELFDVFGMFYDAEQDANLLGAAKLGLAKDLLAFLTAQSPGRHDGDYYSATWKYGFRIKGNQAICTITNSPNITVGDVMFTFTLQDDDSFSGKQLFTDGMWYDVYGQFLGGRIMMRGLIYIWTMDPAS